MAHTGYFWNYDKEAVDAVNAAGLNIASNKNIMANNGYLCVFLTHGTQTPIRANQMGAGPIFKGQHVSADKFVVDKDGNIPIVGTVDGVDISVHGADESAHHAKYTDAEVFAALGVRPKVVEIGDWNMNITDYVDITHGLTLANIRSVSAILRKDDGSMYYAVMQCTSPPAGHEASITLISPTTIRITRESGGSYDGPDYEATSYNRGWIVISHVP